MTNPDPVPDDEPDFAEEHTKPTYEDESSGLSTSDEAAPRGPAGQRPPSNHRPLG